MLRILIVDDDEGARNTYLSALRREGYDVAVADSRATATTALSQSDPVHGMLLDLNLGDGTGYDVLRSLRERHRFVPTAAMTAFRPEFDPDEAIDLGALAYVDHPIRTSTLIGLAATLTRPPSNLDDPNELHTRVLAGDPGALECLCAIFLRQLPRQLERAFPSLSWDLAEDAVSRSCSEYVAGAARRFHPSKTQSVLGFVYTIAWRNLDDHWRSERARIARERRWMQTGR
jgi:DNA-binding response OmpR family regulator